MKKIIFLDRDGVINKFLPNDWVKTWQEFKFLPKVKLALKLAYDNDYRFIIITNQRGIALHLYTEKQLNFIHQKMLEELEEVGIKIEGIYFCPHSKEENCFCRKPNPGMIIQAKKDFSLNLEETIMIGDKETDRQAAKNAHIGKFFLVEKEKDLFYHIKNILK